jgi:inner membrane protein
MFNSTHTLTGILLARTGFDRWTPHAATIAAVAANLPDMDIIAQLSGTPSYIEHHRGITHTLIGVPLLSLIFAAVLWKVTHNFGRTFAVIFLAMATHPLLDFANSYGLRPYLPWSGTWYYGDVLPIIDPYLDLILLGTLFASSYFPSRHRSIAFAGFFLAMLHMFVHVQLRNAAQHRLAEYSDGMPGYQRAAVLPQILNPFTWTGVIETDKEDLGVDINVATGKVVPTARISKTPVSPIVNRAASGKAARVFLDFARFPVTRTFPTASGYRVIFSDFRFYRETTRTAFGTEILLDDSLNILGESMSFNEDVE